MPGVDRGWSVSRVFGHECIQATGALSGKRRERWILKHILLQGHHVLQRIFLRVATLGRRFKFVFCGMTSELSGSPLYFFDQPKQKHRNKRARRSPLENEGEKSKHATQSDQENVNRDEELARKLSGETRGDVEPDTSALNAVDQDPLVEFRRAAPELLNEVARLLSQRNWTEEGRIPHGIVNILNYSWRDRTAGWMTLKSLERTDGGSGKVDEDEGSSRQVSAKDKREAGERSWRIVGDTGPSVRQLPVDSNTKKRKLPSRAQNSTSTTFSISSNSSSNPDWIIRPKQTSCDETPHISLCQWVLERLKAARSPEKLQTAVQDLSKSLILRHYGDARTKLKDRSVRTGQPATLVNGLPRIPEVKQQDLERRKLHYRMEDGSSFIYYPSGCIAVCHSHSGLPCGGFYTNVFSDSKYPAVLATVTASGHGSVTHPHSSAITAVWDQTGGFICDHHRNITEEWSWQMDCLLREKIVQLSDEISVRLLSGTSAVLSFKCNNESVQLPLLAVSDRNQSQETECLQTEEVDSAQDLLLVKRTEHPAVILHGHTSHHSTHTGGRSSSHSIRAVQLTEHPPMVLESKPSLFPSTTSMCTVEVLQVVLQVGGLNKSLAQWRRRGPVSRELKRLQKRVRNILDGWMDYYHVALGIKCPDMERMSDVPQRTRLRREVQALPSLNPPEQADAKPVRPVERRTEVLVLPSNQSEPEDKSRASSVKLPRTPKIQKEEKKEEPRQSCVIRRGPVRIQGNFPLESVIIPSSADLQPSDVTRCPAPPSFSLSAPLTLCPALLRAALLGEVGRRRCCCSAALMPVVTDLEYDAFLVGQPPQQILVVCTTPFLRSVKDPVLSEHAVLEQLYRRMNKHRTMPCTQCQMDSFRLVRYVMSTKQPSCGQEKNVLLRHRHRATPGMVLMYIRGKLLFVGHTFSGHSCSIKDLKKQISKIRGDYRSGLSLSSDYKIGATATDAHYSQDAALKRALSASVEEEKVNESKNNQLPGVSPSRDFFTKP